MNWPSYDHDVECHSLGCAKIKCATAACNCMYKNKGLPIHSQVQPETERSNWLQESSYRAGAKAGWNLALAENADGLAALLAAHRYPRPVRPEIVEGDMGYRTGFMCLIDYEVELGEDSKGTPIYPDERSLRTEHKCVDSCGIAEVKVTLTKFHLPTKDASITLTEALIQESVKKSKSANIPQFPASLRKMWTGSEVQEWIDANWNTVNND